MSLFTNLRQKLYKFLVVCRRISPLLVFIAIIYSEGGSFRGLLDLSRLSKGDLLFLALGAVWSWYLLRSLIRGRGERKRVEQALTGRGGVFPFFLYLRSFDLTPKDHFSRSLVDVLIVAMPWGLFLLAVQHVPLGGPLRPFLLVFSAITCAVATCPSSDNLRHFGQFSKGGSGSSGLEFKRLAADAASVWS